MKQPPLPLAGPAGRVPCRGLSAGDRLSRLLLDLAIWRGILGLAEPVRRAFGVLLLLVRSCWTLAGDCKRVVWQALGWLSAPPRSPALRKLGFDMIGARRWHYALAGIVVWAAVREVMKRVREASDTRLLQIKACIRTMSGAKSWEDWSTAAQELDTLQGQTSGGAAARWKRETRLYDRKLLDQRLRHLKAVRARGDVTEMMFAVRADLLRNLGNMTNSELHENFPLVPEPIREYIDEVKEHLQFLTEYDGPEMTIQDKLAFLRETRHAFGRTALVLSGGGALGAFHVGIVKSLFEQKLLPRVLAGSSVGSIVAAIIGTRNDEELRELFDQSSTMDWTFFSNSTMAQFLRHFLLKGVLQDVEVLQKRLRRLLGDATFLQAFAHSGRILNVAVSPADTNEPARILNYLTAPHVVIWSAVSCSSAFPFLFMPQDLLARNSNGELVQFTAASMPEGERRWRDGSLEEDLPMRSLSETFNVNYFLVSQTNPHIVPALNLKKRFNRKLGNLVETEWKHRCRQLMEVWPSFRWLKVFSQPWEGDVTMVLPSTFMQIKKSITNPSLEDLEFASLQGERVTWEKLSAIQANCGIEMKLDACMVRMGEKIVEIKASERNGASKPRNGLRTRSLQKMSRIPSWLNLSALGMPASAAEEALNTSRMTSMDGGRMSSMDGGRMSSMDGGFSLSRASVDGAPALSRASTAWSQSLANESCGKLVNLQRLSSTGDLERHSPQLQRVSVSGMSPVLEKVDEAQAEDYSPPSFQPAPSSSQLAQIDSLLTSLPSLSHNYGQPPSSMDCTDRSVNLWDTLGPLQTTSAGQALDVIAP